MFQGVIKYIYCKPACGRFITADLCFGRVMKPVCEYVELLSVRIFGEAQQWGQSEDLRMTNAFSTSINITKPC